MAPPASVGEEQGYATLPAAPEQQQVVASDERAIEQALRCFEVQVKELTACVRHATGDLELRCLSFQAHELIYITLCVKALMRVQHVDAEMMRWLETLTHVLNRFQADPIPRRHTLLRRATQCFRSGHRYPYGLRTSAEKMYRLAEHPSRYRHFLAAINCLGLPEEGGNEAGSIIPAGATTMVILLTLYMMSMYPYGYEFEEDRLVTKWVCEGFNPEGLFLPSVGPVISREAECDHYFSCLVDQNVITHAAANNLDEAESWKWNVNHLLHQFDLTSKSAEIGFVFTSHTLNMVSESAEIARRLALHHDDPNIPSLLQGIDLSKIRSLAVSGAVSGVPMDKFFNLVVLDVEGWNNFGDEDLLLVCRSKMFFLVYLSIRNTRIRKLPPEIKDLCNLEILDASCTQVAELPLAIFEATRLHRLDLRGTPIRQLTLTKQILGLQDSLEALLLGGEGVANSTEMTATRVPHDIRHFSKLHTLALVDLNEQPASFIKALGDLHNLRVLAITWSFHQSSDRDYCETFLSSINKWIYLKSLTIHCGLGCSMEFLGSVSDVSLHLETFKVTMGRFAGVPQWFHSPPHQWFHGPTQCPPFVRLSFVQITVYKLEAHDLKILRELPELKCLILGLDFFPREAIVIKNEGFHELRRFFINCAVQWLTFESGAMPRLTYLQLNFCDCPTRPISVPLGISNLRKLTEVALWYNVRYANSSSVKMTVEAVRKEVAKCRNATKMISLFINGIEQYDVQAGAGAENTVQAVHEITEA